MKGMDEQLLEQFVVGFVRGSHGVSGEFKFESYSGQYEHFADMTEVTLRNGTNGDSRKFKVESVEIGSCDSFMKLSGIDTPEDVKKYSRWEIVVPRDKACPLDENEWYVEDLKRCSLVYYPDGEKTGGKGGLENGGVVVGKITDVMEGGSGDLLEISLAENCDLLGDEVKYDFDKKGNKLKVRTVYVPLKEEAGFIGKVDIENKTVQLMHLWILE